jgi:glycosyltransferase involved in cell wall biosynthesis
MKVLLVSSSSGSTGGGEIYLHNLANGLSRLGLHVHALCGTTPGMNKFVEGIAEFCEVKRGEHRNTYQRPLRGVGAVLDFKRQQRICREFRESCADIVHINQQTAEDALDLILAAQRAGIPFVSTIHIVHSAKRLGAKFGRIRDFITAKTLRNADAVHITVAERAKKDLVARFPFLDPLRVRVVLNGVMLPSYANGTARADSRARWGATEEVVLGTVGRLTSQKAPIFALNIIARLRQKALPIRYVWIGDGPMRSAFQAEAQRLDIVDCVHIDGWREDIPNCLQGLDIFMMPSKFEGLPLALLEAMAAGTCPCASDVDGVSEIIHSAVNGYLCAPGNLDMWCKQLELLVRDSDLRSVIGRKAKEVAERRFDLSSMVNNTIKVYEEAIRSHKQSRNRE